MKTSRFLSWLLFALFVFTDRSAAAQQGTDGLSVLDRIEGRIQAAYSRVSPSVVRISRVFGDQGEHSVGSGVIVTADGIIATSTGCIERQNDTPIAIYLSGGQRLTASVLGWSSEWEIALIKIDQCGSWPHVNIDAKAEIKAGAPCISVSYPSPFGQDFDLHPAVRLGTITECAQPFWFATNCALERMTGEFGSPAFNIDGQLLGVVTHRVPSRNPDYTGMELFRRHWGELVAGKNLDRLRLQASGESGGDGQTELSPSRPANRPNDNSNATETAKRATVRLRLASETESGVSGVIVSPDGYVVTCEHHHYPPLEKLTIVLSNGRRVEGKVLGVNPITDLGIAKITQPGDWPYVEMGDSRSMQTGDPCMSIGYPADVRDGQPNVRNGRIVNPNQTTDSRYVYASTNTWGGDSGGGLFDSRGEVVGILVGGNPGEAEYNRIEFLRLQWDFLAAGKPVNVFTQDAFAARTHLRRIASTASVSMVAILCDRKQKALGTVFGDKGLVITKASEIDGELSCRFSDGSIIPASLDSVDRDRDLALLKVELPELTYAHWNRSKQMPRGSLVAIAIHGEPLVGVVSHEARKVPGESGWLPFGQLRESDQGLVVQDTTFTEMLGIEIRKGDVVLELEGKTVRTLLKYQRFTESQDGVRSLNSGDPIQVRIKRGDTALTLRFPLVAPYLPRPSDESPRSSGFPNVFDIDVPLLPDQCGAPVVDKTGCIVGIAIARRTLGRVYVVPTSTVQDILNR